MKYKKIIRIVLIVVALIILISQYLEHEVEIKVFLKFNEVNIIGYSKSDIIKKYGKFDKLSIREYEVDGKVAEYIGFYKVSEKVDFWGPNFNIYYWILFSENDIAIATNLGIHPDEQ